MVLLVICGSHVVVNAPSTSLWSESGVHACHTAQLQSTVRVVTVISVGGVQLTRVSGAVRGSGLFAPVRLGGARPRGRLPSGLFDNFNVIMHYRIIPKLFQNIPNISMRDGAARSHRATRRNKTRLGAAWTRWTRPTATADTPRAPCGASACWSGWCGPGAVERSRG